MTALASRRRRNTVLALVAGIVAAIVAPTLVYVGAKAISNSTAGRNALSDASPEQTFPETPTAMLATVNDKNELTSVTVFVLAPDSDTTAAGYDQRGGSVISVPINVDPGSGDQVLSLHDAYGLGGEEEFARRGRIGAQLDDRLQHRDDPRRVRRASRRVAGDDGRSAT